MKISEFRYMDLYDLRKLCIDQNWCTRMNNDEYDKFLGMTMTKNRERANMTANRLYKMACLIEKYSDDERKNSNKTVFIESVMWYLSHACYSNFQIVN